MFPIIKGSTLNINYNVGQASNRIKLLLNFKIPEIKGIEVIIGAHNAEDLEKFIIQSIPYKLETFYFYYYQQPVNYFFLLREAFSKCTEKIHLDKVVLSCYEFCSLVKASRGVKVLMIQNCTILTDYECDFGNMHDCKIEILDLRECGNKSYSNWNVNKNRLDNILNGIDRCDNLKNTLKKVILYYYDPNKTT